MIEVGPKFTNQVIQRPLRIGAVGEQHLTALDLLPRSRLAVTLLPILEQTLDLVITLLVLQMNALKEVVDVRTRNELLERLRPLVLKPFVESGRVVLRIAEGHLRFRLPPRRFGLPGR